MSYFLVPGGCMPGCGPQALQNLGTLENQKTERCTCKGIYLVVGQPIL